MRTLLAMIISSGVVLATGCAADPVETGPDAPASDFGFTKDTAGQAVRADVSSLGDFAPENGFDRGGAQSVVGGDEEAAGSCSGVCNANVCVCSGDFDCCVVGCVICWEVVQN